MNLRRHERQAQKRAEAAIRQELRDARSDKQQLDRLERAGHGHCKEAQLLRARLEEKNDSA